MRNRHAFHFEMVDLSIVEKEVKNVDPNKVATNNDVPS